MTTTETALRPSADEVIARLGLESHAAELVEMGLTVIPPERLGVSPDLILRMRDALLRLASELTGAQFDVDGGLLSDLEEPEIQAEGSFRISHLFLRDPVFEEYVVNPVVHALMGKMLGRSYYMQTSNGWVKWAGSGYGPDLGLHTDAAAAPEPLPLDKPHVCQSNWLLTDYTKAGGALCYVPGSNRTGRRAPGEGDIERAVAVEAAAGSVVIFSGGTLHGAFQRTAPGLRLSCHNLYARPYWMPVDNYRGTVPAEVIERSTNPELMRMITRQDCDKLMDIDSPNKHESYRMPSVKRAR